MLCAVNEYRCRHANIVFASDRAALLVLDMQEYFLRTELHAYIPSAAAIIPGVRSLIKAFAASHCPVIFTQHVDTSENAGMMALWWKDLIHLEAPESKISAELDVSKGAVIQKGHYDAFYETSLENVLQAGDITQVVITGLMTHLCCETTARSAFMRGYEVFLAIDGTATYTEAFHRAALLNLAHGFVMPMLVEEILSAFEEMKI